ncbi:hypothetical protein N0A02_00490 [Paraburkholderia acidicola]|uniref:Uncharacterized protein n=1 Tax=Paraburkholderia acidicola TaxID=1912599 RepID=A0ABV1LF13_9BURK
MNRLASPDAGTGVIEQTGTARSQSAVKGAFFSEFVDMFDVFLPVAVLSPVLLYFQPASRTYSPLTSLVFVTTLLGRPIGACSSAR